ncbi:MAG: hypothetical protein QQN44_06105 [Nitrosopumilus sp.]
MISKNDLANNRSTLPIAEKILVYVNNGARKCYRMLAKPTIVDVEDIKQGAIIKCLQSENKHEGYLIKTLQNYFLELTRKSYVRRMYPIDFSKINIPIDMKIPELVALTQLKMSENAKNYMCFFIQPPQSFVDVIKENPKMKCTELKKHVKKFVGLSHFEQQVARRELKQVIMM